MLPTQTPEHIPRLTARRSTRTMLKLRLITSDQMQKESCRMTMRKTLKVKSILILTLSLIPMKKMRSTPMRTAVRSTRSWQA